MSGQGVVERASAELSKRINGLSLRVGKQHRNLRKAVYITSRPVTWNELLIDEEFLNNFFWYFTPLERSNLARVCTRWKDLLYRNPNFWAGLALCINYKQFRQSTTYEKAKLYASFIKRGFYSLGMIGAKDEDVTDLINYFPLGSKHVHSLILRWCGISDRGLENLIDHLQVLYELEIFCCNDLSEGGLWACLSPKIVSLKLADCINISDEAVGAVAQLLPSLCEFSLQAYHLTDAALGYFTSKQRDCLNILKLHSCWEITNDGIRNVVESLPNLTILSLSGCTKISDDAIEIISESLKKLRSLDLSWCPRITDLALEVIACDMTALQQLSLDRCVNITDIGVGYLSTMPTLKVLFLRWCSQLRDNGVHHLSTMQSLQVLSLAGCPLLTMGGLCSLTQMKNLRELELTNCPATTSELYQYLHEQLPQCLIIE
ncbi:hypothetical protein PGB90_005400 [Kerria lacca]